MKIIFREADQEWESQEPIFRKADNLSYQEVLGILIHGLSLLTGPTQAYAQYKDRWHSTNWCAIDLETEEWGKYVVSAVFDRSKEEECYEFQSREIWAYSEQSAVTLFIRHLNEVGYPDRYKEQDMIKEEIHGPYGEWRKL